MVDSHSVKGKLGGLFCCRKLAPVSFPVLEKNRHAVLYIAHVICAIGLFLSILAYVGAFAWGTTLSYLSWITIHNPEGTGYAGVMYICQDAPQFSIYSSPQSKPATIEKTNAVANLDRVEKLKSEVKDLKGIMQSTSEDLTKMNAKVFGPPEPKETKAMLLQAAKAKIRHQQRPMTMSFHVELAGQDEDVDNTGDQANWQCKNWAEVHCASSECNNCRLHSVLIAVSGFIGCIAYISFYIQTDQRLNGDDSSFTKFAACASALIGGTNFLFAVFSYWMSCVHAANALGKDAHAGVGLIFMIISAVLKIFTGFLHLGLPVERSAEKTDVRIV